MTTSWATLFDRAEARDPSGVSDEAHDRSGASEEVHDRETTLDSIRAALERRRAGGGDGGEDGA